MSFCYESKFRNIAIATLIATLLLVASASFGTSQASSLTGQRLTPLGDDYQVIDPGESDLTNNVSAASVTTDYPEPSLRGYPAASPFQQVHIRHTSKETLKTLLENLALLFHIEAGTLDTESEMWISKLQSMSGEIRYRVVGEAFSIQFIDENGEIITIFNKPIEIIFTLGLSDTSMWNESSAMIKPYQWDQSEGAWKGLAYEVNSEDNTITAKLIKPGEVALLRNVQVFVPSIQQ